MMFESDRSGGSLAPLKRSSLWVVSNNEFIDSLPYMVSGSKTGPPQCLSPEDTKPAFYLVEPGGVRKGVMKMHVGVTLHPVVSFGFVSVKIIQHYMDLFLRVAGYHFVHEI